MILFFSILIPQKKNEKISIQSMTFLHPESQKSKSNKQTNNHYHSFDHHHHLTNNNLKWKDNRKKNFQTFLFILFCQWSNKTNENSINNKKKAKIIKTILNWCVCVENKASSSHSFSSVQQPFICCGQTFRFSIIKENCSYLKCHHREEN